MMDFCQRYKNCAIARPSGGVVLFTRLRCGQWSCPYCARKNQQKWRVWLDYKLPLVDRVWWMVTVTAHEAGRTMKASLENIRKRIERLIKRMRRAFGEVEYVRVYEKHPKSSAIHAHFIVAGLCPFVSWGRAKNRAVWFVGHFVRTSHKGTWTLKTYLKRVCRDLGMGYQVECRRLEDTQSSVRYVTKYMTKAMQDIPVKGLRHVQTSRKIDAPAMEAENIWEVVRSVRVSTLTRNDRVIDLQTGEVLPYQWFTEFEEYPLPGGDLMQK